MAQWSSSSMRSGSSAATSGSDLVRRNTRMPLRARRAASPSPESWAMKVERGPDQARVGEVEDGPEVAQAVLDRGAGEGDAGAGRDAAQLLGGVVGRVLDGLGLVEHHPPPLPGGQGLDVAHRGAVGGDDHVGVGHHRGQLVGAGAGRAVVDHHPQPGGEAGRLGAQLPTTAGGAITRAAPSPWQRRRWASIVGVLPRPMSRARQPPSSVASRKPSQARASAW